MEETIGWFYCMSHWFLLNYPLEIGFRVTLTSKYFKKDLKSDSGKYKGRHAAT